MLKNIQAKPSVTLGGSCTLPARTGDPATTPPVSVLHPKSLAATLVGNPSCASTTDASSWPLSGTLTITMTETNTATSKPYQIAASIVLRHLPQNAADVYSVSGVVTKGLALGAAVGGTIWLDPVTNPKTPTDTYKTGYQLDSAAATHCTNATPGDASIPMMMFGGGGSSAASLENSPTSGLTFTVQ